METINSILQPIDGYLMTMKRDINNGWYELEIGIPSTWIFESNDDIGCEILNESEVGKLLKIHPKNGEIIVDDLVTFVEVLIETNEEYVAKELAISEKMKKMREEMENFLEGQYKELDELKTNAFLNATKSNAKSKTINVEAKKDLQNKKKIPTKSIDPNVEETKE